MYIVPSVVPTCKEGTEGRNRTDGFKGGLDEGGWELPPFHQAQLLELALGLPFQSAPSVAPVPHMLPMQILGQMVASGPVCLRRTLIWPACVCIIQRVNEGLRLLFKSKLCDLGQII